MSWKEMCCDRLQFMWDNHLLEPREEYFGGDTESGESFTISIVRGFRVRRSFFFMRRDQTLFRCPFCGTDLVLPLEASVPSDGLKFGLHWNKIGRVISQDLPFEIPMAELHKALEQTKARCRGIWPPD